MALYVVAVILTLSSLSAASETDCDELTKPFIPMDLSMVYGKWVYVMGCGEPKPYHDALDDLKSAWIVVSPTSHSHIVSVRWGDNCFNRCIFGEANATVTPVATTFRKNLSDHKGYIIKTCDDCLLWTDSFKNGDESGRYIMQFTRTGKINPSEVAEFQQKVDCLNFEDPYRSYDGYTDLCPDDDEDE